MEKYTLTLFWRLRSLVLTMRTTTALFACLCLSLLANLRGEGTLPMDVQSVLNKRRDAISKIDATYVGELEELKIKYTKLGDLENAVRINDMIASMKPASGDNLAKSAIGRWTYQKWGEEQWFELLENGEARHKSKERGKWRISGSTMYVEWNNGGKASLNLPPKNGVLTGVDAKQGALSFTKAP